MIDLRDVTFGYAPGKPVLTGVNFRLGAGEKVGLIGPNGSGKSTLFHLIVGLLFPSEGTIDIFGKVRRREADFREVRERIGLLFQDADDQLFCPTVAEDVAFGPLNLGRSHEEAAGIVRDTLEMLNLQGFEDRVTYHLSGGEKRLVSMATILAMAPDVLLLDEPASGLHEEPTERLISVLADHVPSYVIISHDRRFLERTTEKIYRLADGTIQSV
ncbi:MAG: ABC transporter ATP-binding protein [Candidatus Latescibacterota bacterium]